MPSVKAVICKHKSSLGSCALCDKGPPPCRYHKKCEGKDVLAGLCPSCGEIREFGIAKKLKKLKLSGIKINRISEHYIELACPCKKAQVLIGTADQVETGQGKFKTEHAKCVPNV